MENIQAFRSAINWTEPFILGVVAFQVIMFVLALVVSRQNVGLGARLSVMIFIAVIVRTAERWNALCAQHWEQIATQNYFDKNGVFVAVVVCCPLLMDCLIMLLMFIREAAGLLVKVKSNEMRRKQKKQSTSKGGKKKGKDEAEKKKQ